DDQWMLKVAPTPELQPILVTTRVEATCAREPLKYKPTITKQEVINAKYPDVTHQKE
ncbi:hypothetical protein KI387_028037, partial [Taxus chinensis]